VERARRAGSRAQRHACRGVRRVSLGCAAAPGCRTPGAGRGRWQRDLAMGRPGRRCPQRGRVAFPAAAAYAQALPTWQCCRSHVRGVRLCRARARRGHRRRAPHSVRAGIIASAWMPRPCCRTRQCAWWCPLPMVALPLTVVWLFSCCVFSAPRERVLCVCFMRAVRGCPSPVGNGRVRLRRSR